MAIGIHVVRVAFKGVSKITGQVVDKGNLATTINDVLQTEHQHVILASADVPNSVGNPTVEAYLKAEAANNYVLRHMDQTMIVTYNEANINDA